ncbi:MerR family transcriptional regulator [Microvirga arabica]|uniref:MerR family transcriptional regulator n=1 Tax=Microvirga arabica TaxID=1128671 RepID=UPI00193A74B0|nr:helix-turn-helix domain-containing protein [Microvirga arabica]MBM1174624.1 helix-turn-helix domain-containing protein [Microvirga arabica]
MDLSIGDVSRRVAVKVPTIRYYEQIGLLPAPPRTEGRQRRYGAEHVSRLSFIRHARDLGFDVEAIREFLSLSTQPDQSCHPADEIVLRHLESVERRIAQLNLLRSELRHMLEECRHGPVRECQIIQVLGDHGQCRHEHGKVV